MLTVATGAPAIAQEPSKEHVRALIAQSMLQQTGQAQTQLPVPSVPLCARRGRAVESLPRRGGAACDRTEHRNRRRSGSRRDSDFSLLGARGKLPGQPDLGSRQNQHDGPATSHDAGGFPSPRRASQNWSAGIAQNLWKGGGNYTVGWTNSRFEGSSSINIRNPQYQSGLTANLTQPLLRNFRIDTPGQSIQTNQQDIAETRNCAEHRHHRRATCGTRIGTWCSRCRRWKWRRARWTSRPLVRDNQARVEIGTMAPIDIVKAQAEEATRRQAAGDCAGNARNSELALKRLIVSGTEDELWASSINPVDRPSTAPEPIDLEAAVTRRPCAIGPTWCSRENNLSAVSDDQSAQPVDCPSARTCTAIYGLTGRGGRIGASRAIDHSVGLLRCAAEHQRFRRADVDRRVELRLSARQERAGGERRAPAVMLRPDEGAASSRSSCRSRPKSPAARSLVRNSLEAMQAARRGP